MLAKFLSAAVLTSVLSAPAFAATCNPPGGFDAFIAEFKRDAATHVEVVTAEDIHGDTGMEIHGFELPEPAVGVQDDGAVQWIVDTLMREEPGTVTLVPTGPLTNIALAVRKGAGV